MSKKGIAFLTTVMLLAIIVLICVGLSVVILRDAYTVKQIKYATQAYFLAEAGAEEAIRILYDSNFDTSGFPRMDVTFGAGSYDVVLTNHPTEDLVLIESTGTVKEGTEGETSRTVEVTVRNNSLEAFDYPVLCGGRMFVAGGSGVYGGDIRSNSANSNWAVLVGGLISTGYVDEDVYACGDIDTTWLGTINGNEYPDSSAVDLPPFDASFFDYYKGLAQTGGLHYSGSKTFTTGTYSPGNGVIFVNGNATVSGNVTINGCLVATGRILINPTFRNNTFTQNQIGNLPALATKGGNIGIYSRATINGLIYTSNQITTFALPLGQIDIDGTLMGKGGIYLYAVTRVDFVRQSPPGLPGGGAPLYVEHWSG